MKQEAIQTPTELCRVPIEQLHRAAENIKLHDQVLSVDFFHDDMELVRGYRMSDSVKDKFIALDVQASEDSKPIPVQSWLEMIANQGKQILQGPLIIDTFGNKHNVPRSDKIAEGEAEKYRQGFNIKNFKKGTLERELINSNRLKINTASNVQPFVEMLTTALESKEEDSFFAEYLRLFKKFPLASGTYNKEANQEGEDKLSDLSEDEKYAKAMQIIEFYREFLALTSKEV